MAETVYLLYKSIGRVEYSTKLKDLLQLDKEIVSE